MPHTRASFVLGHYQEQASVTCCQSGDTSLLVTDLTPFHPQSHLWPDQPGDVGTVHWEGGDATVGPCRMGPSVRMGSCSSTRRSRSSGAQKGGASWWCTRWLATVCWLLAAR